MSFFWVFIGGGLGSMLRFGLSKYFQDYAAQMPLATLLANLLACLFLSAIIYFLPNSSNNEWTKFFLISGFCGGFSTFSTFSFELFQMAQNGQYLWATLYILTSILGGLACFYVILNRH